MSDSTSSEPFLHWLRQALNHLYNPVQLRRNPLFALFGLSQEENASALRRILVNAIEALRPQDDIAPDSDAWRTYRVLRHRYVQQFGQEEVAMNLGLSTRQLQRQTQLALQALADHLRARYDLNLQSLPPGSASEEDEDIPGSVSQELAWLERSYPGEAADVIKVILGVCQTIRPLLEALGVGVELALPEQLPFAAIGESLLRQALLNVYTVAIHSVPGGRLRVAAGSHQRLWVSIQAEQEGDAVSGIPFQEREQNLEMARRLLALSGGVLEVTPGKEGRCPFAARLTLPIVGKALVLVIDDNPDTLQLFQRYLTGSRYAFRGTREPELAISLAEKLSPQAIVLDVMLPGIDGWELLGRLREHPKTRGIPVIVCTILPQEQLALSLGAAAYLRKPVSRAALLSALDCQVEASAQEPH